MVCEKIGVRGTMLDIGFMYCQGGSALIKASMGTYSWGSWSVDLDVLEFVEESTSVGRLPGGHEPLVVAAITAVKQFLTR